MFVETIINIPAGSSHIGDQVGTHFCRSDFEGEPATEFEPLKVETLTGKAVRIAGPGFEVMLTRREMNALVSALIAQGSL